MECSGPITFPADSGNTYDPSCAGSGQRLACDADIMAQKPAHLLMPFSEYVRRRRRKNKKKK